MKHFLILLLSFSTLVPCMAFAEEIPVQIKSLNDIDMVIFGTVPNSNGDPVAILVKNQLGELILVAQITPDDKGNFSLNVTKRGPLWDNTKEFSVIARVPDPQKMPDTEERSYREAAKSDNVGVVNLDLQAIEASKAKCTILGLAGIESCNLQSSLTLGITTSAIIGTVISVSMFQLRKRK